MVVAVADMAPASSAVQCDVELRKSSGAADTLLRAPRMQARSGVWLEGLSKSDAQGLLIVIPWAVVVITLLVQIMFYVVEAYFPSVTTGVQIMDSGIHCCVAAVCAAYLPVALLMEVCCIIFRRNGSRRTCEGWLAILPVILCGAISATFAFGAHGLEHQVGQAHAWAFVHGSWAFRAAASGEFLLQLVWLWAADRLRYPGQPTSRPKRWIYLGLILLWLFTLVGPKDVGEQAKPVDHAIVFTGYCARFLVFIFVAFQTCTRCTGHVHCCCNPKDWKSLSDSACEPGRARLRYLMYYILTKPRFMLLIHLPLGYPLAFLATFASVVRCCYALLIAVLLRPAPAEAMSEHVVETETKQAFDTALALRLCDFAWEAYVGPPAPPAVVVSGCSLTMLNGEYTMEDRDASGYPVYSMALPAAWTSECASSSASNPFPSPLEEEEDPGIAPRARKAVLRRTAFGEWEIAPDSAPRAQASTHSPAASTVGSPPSTPARGSSSSGATSPFASPTKTTGPMQRWVFARDEEANTPIAIEAMWFELDCGQPQPLPNTELRITAAWGGLSRRRCERHGLCRETDARWLLVEEDGPLVEARNDAASRTPAAGAAEEAAAWPEEVSIIVAFRGTGSWSNVMTDARFSLQSLSKEVAQVGISVEEPFRLGAQLARAVEERAGRLVSQRAIYASSASARLSPSLPSGVSLQPQAARRQERGSGGALLDIGPEQGDFTLRQPLAAAGAAAAELCEEGAAALAAAEIDELTPPRSRIKTILSIPCRLLCRCCLLLCFPCQPPSDHEDDDKEFAVATLDEVKTHNGFLKLYASIRHEVASLLGTRLALCRQEGRPVRIYITGHSLGGAIASLCALDLVSLFPDADVEGQGPRAAVASEAAPGGLAHGSTLAVGEGLSEENAADLASGMGGGHVDAVADSGAGRCTVAEEVGSCSSCSTPIVYTFGSPRIGNASFRSIYNGLVPKTFRLVASRDIVPTLPPSISYRQLGREVWLDDTGHPTFVMSWAMRHILPARDSVLYHPMLSYFKLLAKAHRLAGGTELPSVFRHEPALRVAFQEERHDA
mmetsp:Transcript_98850/g.316917  ORF Transcript_98850/g.316917 Transcript_98850/m.316917 type:complete len:1065 (-) Transcript_98850:134-3328(-)